ncbi:putative bifunctional diguanylate cyclase/phosphodiesterase [Methylobacterium planeticum]|uniref:EAL domain-containing protein n=1 Tax=Methylobacterium planeticum TaxID=2615211 RepID=A0A6N6MNV8_9HYPH|nr:EAL domain-containing protein [Methylobacterium planeticum]KAB1071594.1 EAL domain-containing protein [Methylobacterium planeticum]
MKSIRSIRRLLTISADEPDLVLAQIRSVARQIPLLYATLTLNALAVAYTHYDIAPVWLTVLPVGLLAVFCATRVLQWRRLRVDQIDATEAVHRLRTTIRLVAIMGSGLCIWSFALSRSGGESHHVHVLFSAASSLMACIFCLMHLRPVALIIATTVVPVTLVYVVGATQVGQATILNFACIILVMIFIQSICYRDFVHLVRLGAETRALAHTDMLTGLPNRRSFFARLDATLAESGARKAPFVVAMIDLDGFKPVNDSVGHHAGDAVLHEVGRRLQGEMAGLGWAARLGGDEFGLIIDGAPDLDALGLRLCAALGAPYALADCTAKVGASIGFARYPANAESAALLVERADAALYSAKTLHRGGAVCYDEAHEARRRGRAVLEQALRGADLAAEFDLAFQPIVTAGDGRIASYEALARWTSPLLGRVSPADFIPVAERSGLIVELTAVLLRKALAALRRWPEEIRISFNLSSHDIASADGLARIEALVLESGVAPSRIVFEVTESCLVNDMAEARRALLALRALGASIALDDFGTGYSSLSYVQHLPIRTLKIDRSFVADIDTNAASLSIVRSIIDLCRALDLTCIVEGIETEAQRGALCAAGCSHMQGFLFSRPLPQAELAALHAVALPRPAAMCTAA